MKYLEYLEYRALSSKTGWMQFMFLLYHYYHAEDVYNAIRIMITCYVWMTGFGNFSFFYMKRDFGLVRVLQMLWRLNFLVAMLCLVMGNTYILYYICLLHTRDHLVGISCSMPTLMGCSGEAICALVQPRGAGGMARGSEGTNEAVLQKDV